MNTKELLSIARFCYARIDDNDVVDIVREEVAERCKLSTADGVLYYVSDQDVHFEGTNYDLGSILLKAHMPSRLLGDQDVEVYLDLQKLSPMTTQDLVAYGAHAEREPM